MVRQRKGFGQFLYEEKKKEKPKKTETKKSKAGADDAKYVRMMEKYKRLRGQDQKAAMEIYKEAMKLQERR